MFYVVIRIMFLAIQVIPNWPTVVYLVGVSPLARARAMWPYRKFREELQIPAPQWD